MASSEIEVPEGFAVRSRNRLSPATLKARPTSYWQGDLRRLQEAGAGERWITPREAGLGSAAGIVGSLLDRGALLVAERRSTKRYRLTAYGVAVAEGRRN